MALSLQVNPGVRADNTQKFIRIQGTMSVVGTGSYPVGGLPLDSVILALSFSALVGVVFGVWPARRASTMDPITALRYE